MSWVVTTKSVLLLGQYISINTFVWATILFTIHNQAITILQPGVTLDR